MSGTEKLIEFVKKYPILFDLTHEDYKNIRKKDKLWDEIGQEIHITGEEAKKRWKNLRDTYVRFIRINKTKTGQAAKQSKKWQWSDHMEAFRPFLTFAKTSSNVPEYTNETESTEQLNNANDNTQETNINEETETCDFSENQENNDVTCADRSDDNTTPSRTSKKQKTTKSSTRKPTSSVESVISYFENKKTSGTKDDLDLLFESYARTIKKFSGRRQAETKLQIAQLIAQQEILHYEEQSQQQVSKPHVNVSRPSTSNSYNSDFNPYVSPPLMSPNSGDEKHQQQQVSKPHVDVSRSRPSTSNSYNSDFNLYGSPPLMSPNSGDENHQQQQVSKPHVDVSRPSTSNSYSSDFNSYVSPPLMSPNSGDENHQTQKNSTAEYLRLFNPYIQNL